MIKIIYLIAEVFLVVSFKNKITSKIKRIKNFKHFMPPDELLAYRQDNNWDLRLSTRLYHHGFHILEYSKFNSQISFSSYMYFLNTSSDYIYWSYDDSPNILKAKTICNSLPKKNVIVISNCQLYCDQNSFEEFFYDFKKILSAIVKHKKTLVLFEEATPYRLNSFIQNSNMWKINIEMSKNINKLEKTRSGLLDKIANYFSVEKLDGCYGYANLGAIYKIENEAIC